MNFILDANLLMFISNFILILSLFFMSSLYALFLEHYWKELEMWQRIMFLVACIGTLGSALNV